MSIAREHNEWLSLVPSSGPFLSLETLLRVFPQGLPARHSEIARLLRIAYSEWQDEGKKRHPDPALHELWVRWVLITLLGLPTHALHEGQAIPEGIKAEKKEQGATLRPRYALMTLPQTDNLSLDLDEGEEPGSGEEATVASETVGAPRPLLLVQVYGRGQGLEKSAPVGDGWVASPVTRMQELLTQTRLPLGLVTNVEDWALVQRVTEAVGVAHFSVPIWLEEEKTLRAFRALLGPERFFGAPSDTLEKMLADSANEQQEVTDQLGYQVRHAVELLVQAIDEIDRNRNGELLQNVSAETLYEGALTLMMRLVFLLCAEEREMFPLDDEVYSRHYALSTLLAQLREAADAHGEEVLERRRDAWSRLQATFRAIYAGVEHEAMRMPKYGGNLLDPARFAWMDCHDVPLPIHNRTVLHLLESLQVLRVKGPGGGPMETRRVSFRALDVEQIGHVYEGLLDHTAVRATEPVLGLPGTKALEPEILLSVLEAKARKSRKDLVAFLKEETGRSDKSLQTALDKPQGDENRLRIACEGDAELVERVRPFLGLVRRDDFDRYVVIPTGHVYVTCGTARRSSGTHYTPKVLAEDICRRTLERLVYTDTLGEGGTADKILKSPREILALRVCDPTVGAGSFLVAACRYLAARLCEAWAKLEAERPGEVLTSPEGDFSQAAPKERIIPDASKTEERETLARRLIAERCLFGVDKNPMAAEIAKLSLWLITMNRGKPFHFLDHAIKVGDSLLGCHKLHQLKRWTISAKPDEAQTNIDFFTTGVIDELIALRQGLLRLPSDTPEQVHKKEKLHQQFEAKAERARLMGDLILAPELMKVKPKEREKKRKEWQASFVALPNPVNDRLLRQQIDAALDGNRPFHWPLEFIDVFERPDGEGFDCMMGNPPFMGGQKITGAVGDPYRKYLIEYVAQGRNGSADLVAYFFLRAVSLLRDGGTIGMIATNTLAQGDTREVGLEQIITGGYGIYTAESSRPWPGKAALEIAVVHLYAGEWTTVRTLNEDDATKITAFLDNGEASGKPYRLQANAGKSFQGSIVLGMGFVLEPEQAQSFIARNPQNADVLFPYLNGEDLNSRPDQSPSRWVINFKDWPLGRIGQFLPFSDQDLREVAVKSEVNLSQEERPDEGSSWATASKVAREKWLRLGVVPSDYPNPVACDYPDCLWIVEERVKPERAKNNRDVYRLRWWHYGEKRPDLYAAIARLPRVLVKGLVTATWAFTFAQPDDIFMHKLGVFPLDDWGSFASLNSSFHAVWARQYSSSLGGLNNMNYSPSDCFETFSFPDLTGNKRLRDSLNIVGEMYHEHRQNVCKARALGLTKVYNLFHDPACSDADIAQLRELHLCTDTAVANAYGWGDLDLRHGFYGDAKDTRYTLHPDARNEVLRRLLALNHARYAEEHAQSEDIFPTLDTEEEAIRAKYAPAANAPLDPAGGLFGGQTLMTFADNIPPASAEMRRAAPAVVAAPAATPNRTPAPTVLPPSVRAERYNPNPFGAVSRSEVTRRTALLMTYLVMRAINPEKVAQLAGRKWNPLHTARAYHRVRLAKHIYVAQEMVQAGAKDGQPFPGLPFRRFKKGPYTEQIEEAELLAVRNGWIEQGDPDRPDGEELTIRYALGPNVESAVLEVLTLLGTDDERRLNNALVPLDEKRPVHSEQWATVHFAWKRLHHEDAPPTDKEVEEYVYHWKESRSMFAPERTRDVLRTLRFDNLLR